MIEFTAPEDRIIRSVTRKVTDRVTEKVIGRYTTNNMQQNAPQPLTKLRGIRPYLTI